MRTSEQTLWRTRGTAERHRSQRRPAAPACSEHGRGRKREVPPLSASQRGALRRTFILAGLAGAFAEVAWVTLVCAMTPLSGVGVLRQVTASVLPWAVAEDWAPAFGLGLHFMLGVAIAWAFGVCVWQDGVRRGGARPTLAAALSRLTAIWIVNFFVLLPIINAAFVTLMPYGVTFASHLLFALAMAATLTARSRERTQAAPPLRRAHPR